MLQPETIGKYSGLQTTLRYAASPQLLRGHAISLFQSALQMAKPLVKSVSAQEVFWGAERLLRHNT